MDYGVEEAFFEEELGALEAFRELLADGLLDDARAGKADEGAGFGDVEVAEHSETGGDAAGGGIGEDADVGNASVVELGQGGGDLGHLHEADDALHHAGSAGCGDYDERLAGGAGAVDGAGDGFADYSTHGSADEAVFHGADDDCMRSHLANGVDDGVVEPGFLLGFLEALLIGFYVGEVERVCGAEACIDELVAGFEEEIEALPGVDFEVVLALGADVQVGLEVGLPDGLATAEALDPEAFGADDFLLVVAGDRGFRTRRFRA